jgi:hypothetical protein
LLDKTAREKLHHDPGNPGIISGCKENREEEK